MPRQLRTGISTTKAIAVRPDVKVPYPFASQIDNEVWGPGVAGGGALRGHYFAGAGRASSFKRRSRRP
jgi:hypothetical protein